MKKTIAICLLVLAMISASEAKWKAPKTSQELLIMFPVSWVASVSGIKVSKAVPSKKEEVVISCDYFVAGQKEMAVGIVYEKYVSYNSNRRNWERHLRVIKNDPKIKADHYLVYYPKPKPIGLLESICITNDGDNYFKIYSFHPKLATEEKLVKLAVKIAEAIKK